MLMEERHWKKCFLHIDMDAFFASVEQKDHPEWKGKPVIVGGLPGERRSVVSTASYEARKFGVHSAMPVSKAYELCPNGIYTHGNMKRYMEISSSIMEILSEYSPDVDQLSIDEACIDLTGTEKLFGPQEKTAEKIRKEVFEKTGLTVSAGLASTRYLSKMASEINKPDGFYEILPGNETTFMLNQKLEKIWGIGDKTISKLHSFGFWTTKQLYDQKEETLKTIFGSSTASFLYNCLRGNELMPPKKSEHSISAETTFSFDLTNLYNAQTALMELCSTVMFRLNKEKGNSKTCAIKIRYEDFSTFTVQETLDEYITTSDELFLRTSKLLEKKYETGRGIRLLGVSVSNIESNGFPRQENLIDFGEKKKQAVEESIMDLSRKFPEIKIKKARLLENILDSKKNLLLSIAFLSIFSNFSPLMKKIYCEETKIQSITTGTLSPENSGTLKELPLSEKPFLFSFGKDSKEVSFFANGWWQTELTDSFSMSFNPSSKNSDETTGFSIGVPVFKQKVDLSVSLLVAKQWFFETNFADEFNKNTIAFGFIGKDDNYLRKVRIANRGIIFPSTYSIDDFNLGIGGGDNQAPGVLLSFKDVKNDKWKSDAVFRYDVTKQNEQVFYGKNLVSTKNIELSDYIKGQLFFLPGNLCSKLTNVYVEDKSGSYKDKEKRLYKKLNQSDFMTFVETKTVVLSKSAGSLKSNGSLPHVIFEFSSISESEIKNEAGSYSDESSYLGKIQKYFGSRTKAKNFALSAYSYNFYTTIDSKTALLVQSPQGFSPFIQSFRYDAGTILDADVMIADKYTEEKSSDYGCETAENTIDFVSKDFFYQQHLYVDAFNETSSGKLVLEAEDLFPFADQFPEIYVNSENKGDLFLITKTYTPVSRLSIGTDASKGSVHVYKNGILDGGASYNSETGEVTLSSSISDFDKIYITWNEDSSDFSEGNIAFALGFLWNFSTKVSADADFATEWNVQTEKKYADENKSSYGYHAFASGFKYEGKNLNIKNSNAFSIQNQNTTGLYRILSMDELQGKTFYLNKSSGNFIPSDFVPVLKSISGLQTGFPTLESEENKTVESSSKTGVSIKGITGYAIPLSFSFDSSVSKKQWAAINVKISEGYELSSSNEFSFALKASDFEKNTGYDIYLQLGIDGSDDPDYEDREEIPSWKINCDSSPSVPSPFKTNENLSASEGWQTVTIHLSDEERARITNHHDMRIIVTGSENLTESLQNTIYIGPYEIKSQGMTLKTSGDLTLNASEKKDNSVPKKDVFNDDDNFAQKISWTFNSTLENENTFIKAQKYFSETDLSSYKKLVLYFKVNEESSSEKEISDAATEDDETFTLLLDDNGTSIETEGKISLKAVLKRKDFQQFFEEGNDKWHEIEIFIQDEKLKIDGAEITPSSLIINKKNLFNRLLINFSPSYEKSGKYLVHESGSIYFDELHLSGIDPYYLLQDKTSIQAENKDLSLKINDFPVIESPFFKANLLLSKTFSNEFGTTIDSESISSDMESSIRLFDFDLSLSANLSSAEKGGIGSIVHTVKTHEPILKTIILKDSFNFNHSDYSASKENSFSLDFKNFKIPLSLEFEAASSENRSTLKQNLNLILNSRNSTSAFVPTLDFAVSADQKEKPNADYKEKIKNQNYYEALKESYKSSFSFGSEDSYYRKVSQKIAIEQALPFLSSKIRSTWNLFENYSTTKNIYKTDDEEFSFSMPFSISENNFEIKYTKKGSIAKSTEKGGTYKDDFSSMYSSIGENSWFWSYFVFQDIFDSSLGSNLFGKTKYEEDSLNSLLYSASYESSWKRNLFGNLTDFFAPSKLSFEMERDIRTSKDTSDIYQYKLSLFNSSVNLFGKDGTASIFKWFNSDEYSSSFTGILKLPEENPSAFSLSLSAYFQGTLFIDSRDSLKFGSEIKFSSTEEWSISELIILKRKTSFNPLLDFVKLFSSGKFKDNLSKAKSCNTECLDISLSKSSSDYVRNYTFSHKTEGEVNRFISVSLGFDIGLNCYETKSDSITATISAGAKLMF